MELVKGTLLQGGKYIIESKLGQGGFGITYLAYQQSLKRKVAIKEFYMKDCCQRDERTAMVTVPTKSNVIIVDKYKKKFISEALRTSELAHPNIISIIDCFEENDTAYYVMPYMPGGSLAQHNGGNALPEAEALKYIRQVADALSFLHKQHKNHLDVKPGNIVLDQYKNAVLIDFGISKIYDDNGKPLTTTDTLTNVGCTPGYAPLEQQYAKEQFAATYDIYALGATFYRLLAGTTPPDAGSLASGEENLQPLPDTISLSTRNAVYAAMRIIKQERTQSIEEFLKILDGKASTSAISEDTTISTSTSDITTLNFDNTNTSKNINGANSGGNSQGNNADSSLNKEVKDTEKKDNLWQKLKIEFAKRHIITNIVLVICFIWILFWSLIAVSFPIRPSYKFESGIVSFISIFALIGFTQLLFNRVNGFIIMNSCVILSIITQLAFKHEDFFLVNSITIFIPLILSYISLNLKKKKSSGFKVILQNKISPLKLIISLCFSLPIMLINVSFFECLFTFLASDGTLSFFINWTCLFLVITEILGLSYILKGHKTGVFYLSTFIILYFIMSLTWGYFGFVKYELFRPNNFQNILLKDPLFFACIILIVFIFIMASLFWKHNGKSNFSQMTDGKGIANTKNAIKICVGVIAFAVLAVFVVS